MQEREGESSTPDRRFAESSAVLRFRNSGGGGGGTLPPRGTADGGTVELAGVDDAGEEV